jgi:hypothetical protein
MIMLPRLIPILVLAHVVAGNVAALAQSRSEARTALVIGNGAYSYARLANPGNDARAVADALRSAGFEVILRTDADQRDMRDAIRALGAALKAKGGVGLFYFAGHGVQANGENFILPIGEAPGGEQDLKANAVTAAEAVDTMAAAGNGLNIVILDACRDNPLPGAGATRGLSRIDSGASLFVSFSTSPGAVALDGEGRNSPYTKHLARAIATPNLTLEDTFKRTLKGVHQETGGKQTPWISSSFFGDFVFRADRPVVVATAPPDPQNAVQPFGIAPGKVPSLAGVYRSSGTNADGSKYSGIAAITPAGEGLRFTWWIGKEVYSGIGTWAGRMLVVDWGRKHPVVYTFPGGDNLDGEWADGTATDRLELAARAAPVIVPAPQGRYRVAGKNPNGSSYNGWLTVTRRGEEFQFEWNVGGRGYRGSGTRDGNILKVDWGGNTPMVYALTADGHMVAMWSGGSALEVARPER